MTRFLISHFSDERGILQIEAEAQNKEEGLKCYYDKHIDSYSKDSTGFTFFKEDFFDEDCPSGAIYLIEENHE